MFLRSVAIRFSFSGKNISSRNFSSLITSAPYRTKEIFTRATEGAFRPVSRQQMSPYYPPYIGSAEEIKEMSWDIYKNSIQAENKAPAFIYTGADFNIIQPLEGELVGTGRLYAPSYHIWSANATWLLSQVHKMREIVAISDPIYAVSGLTKELVCAFRAGYKLNNITHVHEGRSIVHLAPPTDEQALKTNLFNFLSISENDCVAAQRKFNQEKTELLKHSPSDSRHDFTQFLNHSLFKKNYSEPTSVLRAVESLYRRK